MASSKEYLHFILEQLADLEEITYRTMMGEYIIYYREKIVGGIYDDRLLVKSVKAAVTYMSENIYEPPYEEAKKCCCRLCDRAILTILSVICYLSISHQAIRKMSQLKAINAEIMIHQPAIHGNGVSGQVTDIKIVSDQLQKSKQRLNRILAENTGRTIEEISRDTERDNFMTAGEALQYGLIDQVIKTLLWKR